MMITVHHSPDEVTARVANGQPLRLYTFAAGTGLGEIVEAVCQAEGRRFEECEIRVSIQ